MSADTSGLNRCGEWVNELISAIQGEQSFPDSSIGKEFACNARDPGSIPGMGRSTGEGIGYPLQYSWASQEYWKSTGEGIGYPLQYSWASLWLSWQRIHLQCRRPGFDPWVGKITWRRERLLTPVFWPGEFHGLRVAKSQTRLRDFHLHFHIQVKRLDAWECEVGPYICLGQGGVKDRLSWGSKIYTDT